MAKYYTTTGLAALLVCFCIKVSNGVLVLESKCTPGDSRKIYPKCMQYSVDKTVWCDQSNYTTIPDPDKILTYKSCRDASALFINDSCLETIKKGDLGKYTHIKSFKCGRNRIKSIPDGAFDDNKELRFIDFCTNKISKIGRHAFRGLSELRELYLSNNEIDVIPKHLFQDTKNLVTLSLHGNRLQVLNRWSFMGLENLEVLRLTGNKIGHISPGAFAGLKKLTHLHLDQNKITGFEDGVLEDLPNLKVLTVSHNEITYWPAVIPETFKDLHTINLGFNLLTDFKSTHIANMSKLQNLSLENNSLTRLSDDVFGSTPHLRYLDFSDNDIEEIGRNTFARLCHLETLDLSNNKLKRAIPEWFTHVIGNNYVEGNNISGNDWRCDCGAVEYAEFHIQLKKRAKIDPEWYQALTIVCSAPKMYQDDGLNEYTLERIQTHGNCPDTPTPTAPPAPCNSSEPFVRITETSKYEVTTTQTEPTTNSESTPTIGEADFEMKEGILPEKEALKSGTDSPLIIVIALIVVVSAVLVVTVMVLRRRVDTVRKSRDLERGGSEEKIPGGPNTPSNRTDSTELRITDDQSPLSPLIYTSASDPADENRLRTTSDVTYNRLSRDRVTKPCHDTHATATDDATPRDATADSENGANEHSYLPMQPIQSPDVGVEQETRPKEAVRGCGRLAELRNDPEGRSATDISPSITIPKQHSITG